MEAIAEFLLGIAALIILGALVYAIFNFASGFAILLIGAVLFLFAVGLGASS